MQWLLEPHEKQGLGWSSPARMPSLIHCESREVQFSNHSVPSPVHHSPVTCRRTLQGTTSAQILEAPVVGAQAQQHLHNDCMKAFVFAVTADQAISQQRIVKTKTFSKESLRSASVLVGCLYCQNALYWSVPGQPLLQSFTTATCHKTALD